MFQVKSPSLYLLIIYIDSTIIDLDATDFTEFSTQAASWTLSEAVCPTCDHTYTIPTTSCWPTTTWKTIGGPNILGPSGSSAKNQYIQKEYPPMEKFPTYAVLQYHLTIFADVALGSSTIISNTVEFYINGQKSGSGSNSIGQCNPNMVDSQGITILTLNRYSVGRAIFDLSSISESQNGKGVTLKFLNNLDYPSNQRSWGVRNLKLYLFRNASQYSATNFPCGYGFFWDDDLGCTACHPFCKTCTGATNNECSSCNSPYLKYPNTTCLDTCVAPFTATSTNCNKICTLTATPYYVDYSATCSATCNPPLVSNSDKLCSLPCGTDKYQYPDGSCQIDCDAPFEQGTTFGGYIKTCTSTCANYLYFDGSCQADCPAPLLTKDIGSIKFCYNPCEGTDNYLYPDSSCVDTCESPLKIESGVDGEYCKNPCEGTSDYLFPDGSCDDTCSVLLSEKTEHDIKYCYNPCKESDTYLASNQECQATCPSPSIIKEDSTAKYCVFPCEDLDDYYNEETGKCQVTCNSPYRAVDYPLPKICRVPLETTPTPGGGEPTSTETIKKVIKATNSGNSALSAGVFAFTILNPLDSTLSLIGSFSKMIQYIKYMKIDYPEKVQLMLKEQSDSFQDFPNKMAPELLKKFPEHQLPERFMVHNTSSSFFVNFWSTVFKLAVILFVSLVVIGIAIQRKKNGKPVDGSLKVLLDCLQWNLFITYFCSNIGDGVLFTALEMRTLHLDSAAGIISFILCIVVNVGTIYTMYMILSITWTIRKSKKRVVPLGGEKNEPEKNWASCQTLFAPYQERFYYQHIYLFLFLVRVSLFSAMLGYLFDYPLLQASAFVLCGILMLSFLIIKKPMKDNISHVMEIIFELVLLPYNLCVLVLAIMDKQGVESIDHRNRLGNLLIYINLIAPYLAIAMTVTKAFLICLDFYKEYKAEKVIKVMKGNFKAIRPEIILNASQSPDISITKFSPSSSLVDKNLIGNSQKIDLDEEPSPSPSPSPGRRLIADSQRRKLSSMLATTSNNHLSFVVN